MNDYIQNFMGFEGRLNRQPFWLGIVGLIVAAIVINVVLGGILGASMFSTFGAMMGAGANSAAMAEAVASANRTAGWVGLIGFLILAYPGLSLWIKRAHDRDQSGNLVIVFYGLVALNTLLQAFGLNMSMTDLGGVQMPTPNLIGSGLGLVLFVFGLYLLVTLGFLKGTDGSNQYGDDPLGGSGAQTA